MVAFYNGVDLHCLLAFNVLFKKSASKGEEFD
jgi:hypothetical protein